MSRVLDLVGQKMNRLTVIRRVENSNAGKTRFECLCDCGNTVVVVGSALLNGNTKSCGCLKLERIANLKYRHGERYTRLYRIWSIMHSRCKEGSSSIHKNHGNRGITVCEDWKDFAVFREWATANGYRDDLTIDRIDNDGNYCPENCRWANRFVQANNTRKNHFLTYNGETHTVSEWARIVGLQYHTLLGRINNYHWSVEKALTTPVKENTT